jgi:hypothetical protein
MVNQGLINTRGYSLYLDDLQEAIIPGRLLNGTTEYAFPAVPMSLFSMTTKAGATTSFADHFLEDYPVVLDSGSTVSLLDPLLGQELVTAINGVYDYQTTGLLFVDCALRNTVSTFNFAFGGTPTAPKVTIKVPISELVYDLTGLYAIPAGVPLPRLPFKNACAFGIMFNLDSPPSSTTILGDTFLRSAYVVYDLQNNLIGMAQTNFDSNKTNLVEFVAGEKSFPDVAGVPVPASVAASVVSNAPVSVAAPVVGKTTSARVVPSKTTARGVPPKSTKVVF